MALLHFHSNNDQSRAP